MPSRYALLLSLLAAVSAASAPPPLHAQDLGVYMTTSSNVVAPGDRLTYTLTASNANATDLTDVVVRVRWPEGFAGPRAIGGDLRWAGGGVYGWTVGALKPGKSQAVTFFVEVPSAASPGDVTMEAVASATGASDVTVSATVTIDPTPLLRLSVAAEAGPAVAGEPLAYVLTFGNVGSSSPDAVTLRLPVPEGTSFDSATAGGRFDDGVVTWELGTLGVGASGQVRLVVEPAPGLEGGTVLEARAELDPGTGTDAVVGASTATPVREREPLRLAYAVSQEAVAVGDRLALTLLAANTGQADLTDVLVEVLWPTGFAGPRAIGGDLRWTGAGYGWAVGVLGPGESQAVTFFVEVPSAAQQGEVHPTLAVATSSEAGQVRAARAVQVDPTPLLRLSVAAEAGPAVAGEPLAYVLTLGNAGSASAPGTVLRMTIPEGVSIDSTSGRVDGEVVAWDLGTLNAGTGMRMRVRVRPEASLPTGTLLVAEAELDPGGTNETTVRSSAATPVGVVQPLEVEYATNEVALEPGDPLEYDLVATNTAAADLADVFAEVLWPEGLSSPRIIVGDGFRWTGAGYGWTVGALAPSQTRTLTFGADVPARTTRGSILRSVAVAEATGSRQVVLQQDVLVGELVELPTSNGAPTAAVITSPASGAAVVIGGTEGEAPGDPDKEFAVAWEPATDPDGDPLTYTWQLSKSSDFSGALLFSSPSLDGGAATRFETDHRTMADSLTANEVALYQTSPLYHRVVASDGRLETASAVAEINLTRGTIVALEQGPGLPEAFALHGNYPNPFNPTTTFRFDLPQPAHATLTVYDALGREVATIVAEPLRAGSFRYTWEAGHLPSGVYLYRLEAGSHVDTKKLVLLK